MFIEDGLGSGERILLRTTGLTKRYGGVVAIDRVDLTLRSGEVCGVIGLSGLYDFLPQASDAGNTRAIGG